MSEPTITPPSDPSQSIPRRRGRPKKNPAPRDGLPPIEEAHQPKPERLNPLPPPAPGIAINDVVQVFNQNSQYYGVLFIIGDIQSGRVHGFHMMAGGRKEFVTAGVEECFPIGVSKCRSKEPCSPQWRREHKMP